MNAKRKKDILTMESATLETAVVRIGSTQGQTTVYGKPFPLVLEPVSKGACNFVEL